MYYEVVSNKGFYLLAGVSREKRFRTMKRAQGKKFEGLRRAGSGGDYRGLYIIGGLILFILVIALIHKQITKYKNMI